MCILISKILIKVFIYSLIDVPAIKNQLHIINENGPEGLLEIPRLTIFHRQAWGRSEQGCTSKILAKCSYQLMPVSNLMWVKITHRLFRSEKLSLTLNCSFFAKSNSIVSCSIPKIRRNISQDLAGGETSVDFQTHADFVGLNQPEVFFGMGDRFD